MFSGICGVTWFVVDCRWFDAPEWTPFDICPRYIKLGRSEVGTGLYPRALCLVQCGRWAYPIVWTVVALLDGGLRFFFLFVCPSSESGWDGRVVWWSVSLSSGLWMGRACLVFLPDSGESRLEW